MGFVSQVHAKPVSERSTDSSRTQCFRPQCFVHRRFFETSRTRAQRSFGATLGQKLQFRHSQLGSRFGSQLGNSVQSILRICRETRQFSKTQLVSSETLTVIGKLENRVKLAGEIMKGVLVTSWSGINCSAVTMEFGLQQSDVFTRTKLHFSWTSL